MKNKIVTFLVTLFAVAEVVLMLLSWLLSALTASSVHSLLSGEGMRWLLGQYVDALLSPVLSWILLFGIAIGLTVKCGIKLRMVVGVMACFLLIVLLITLMPHSILLSATGALYPSPFSRALLPLTAFGLSFVSVVYGLLKHSFTSLHDVVQAAVGGVAWMAPWIVVYVFVIQFCESLCYVLSLNTNY